MLIEAKHITICICTYKRPEMLRRLLSKLEDQETENLFECSVVIVDNDKDGSARSTVESFSCQSRLAIQYDIEPEQNIAVARNRAIGHAKCDYVALIDDDEFPNNNWLLNLYKAIIRYEADGILGPVLPYFEQEPPEWIIKGRFFDRAIHPTGHILEWKNTRTGNALLKKNMFKEQEIWFNPVFCSGGEDRDFFRRKIEEGHIVVWCNEAPVYETIPQMRWRRKVLLKRALIRGKMALKSIDSKPLSVLKSMAAICIYTGALPLLFFLGHHIFMKYLIKEFDHLGKLFAFLGIEWVREKYVKG
jgi:glycosyltransferase involved in cell wall biosynthesis